MMAHSKDSRVVVVRRGRVRHHLVPPPFHHPTEPATHANRGRRSRVAEVSVPSHPYIRSLCAAAHWTLRALVPTRVPACGVRKPAACPGCLRRGVVPHHAQKRDGAACTQRLCSPLAPQ